MSDSIWEFDLSLKETLVTIGGTGYVLREADEAAAAKWRNAVTNCTRFTGGKLSGLGDGLGETQSVLVSLCLFNGDNNLVPIETIRSWPARIVKSLFEEAKSISDLREGEGSLKELKEQRDDLIERIKDLEGNTVKND